MLKWFDEEGGVAGATVADCGCGTGGRRPLLGGNGARSARVCARVRSRQARAAATTQPCPPPHRVRTHAGSLAIPLALRGADVVASDISSSMAGEAERRWRAAASEGCKGKASFEAKDLE